jgi:hypothetical protein
MKSRIINEYGIVYIQGTDGHYIQESEPEPKISGLWLMAMGIGTFAAVCFIGTYFVLEAIAGA